MLLLLIAAAIALPLTYIFFQKVLLAKFAYHSPIGVADMLIGLFFVAGIAFIMIGAHTLKVLRSNPATVLKTE